MLIDWNCRQLLGTYTTALVALLSSDIGNWHWWHLIMSHAQFKKSTGLNLWWNFKAIHLNYIFQNFILQPNMCHYINPCPVELFVNNFYDELCQISNDKKLFYSWKLDIYLISSTFNTLYFLNFRSFLFVLKPAWKNIYLLDVAIQRIMATWFVHIHIILCMYFIQCNCYASTLTCKFTNKDCWYAIAGYIPVQQHHCDLHMTILF